MLATFSALGNNIIGLAAGSLITPLVLNLGWKVSSVILGFGIRSEGLISSAQSIGSKIGIGIGSALTGWILASVGYDPTAKPTAAIISAVKFDYTWMGAILGIVILVLVLLLDVEKYTDQYNTNKKEVRHKCMT